MYFCIIKNSHIQMVFSLQILRQLTVKFTTILRQIGVTTRYEIKSHGIKKA